MCEQDGGEPGRDGGRAGQPGPGPRGRPPPPRGGGGGGRGRGQCHPSQERDSTTALSQL